MIKPDLLICWIKHSDYPVFRMFLERHRHFFGKVIIYWSEHFRDIYFDKFIQKSLEHLDITFLENIDYSYGVEDWRNVATRYMLKHTDSEWVCSVEQDWFAYDYGELLEKVEGAMHEADLVGWMEVSNMYIHPAFWFMKREALERTNKDFAAHDKHDHFGWITEDANRLGMKVKTIQELGYEDYKDSFHLGGVNQNYLNGLDEGYSFHRPDIFYVYNYFCRKANVAQDPRFTELSLAIEKKIGLSIDPEQSEWAKFFR